MTYWHSMNISMTLDSEELTQISPHLPPRNSLGLRSWTLQAPLQTIFVGPGAKIGRTDIRTDHGTHRVLYTCCMLRDWHLESAFVHSSLWLNAKYIGVSAQSRQPNTDGNLFHLESESGRNEKKNAKDRTSRTLVTLVSVCMCVCVWLNFMLDLLWHLNFHCNWKRVWAVINVVHVVIEVRPERSWDPPAARVATQTQAQIWGDDGGEGVFKFHTSDGKACCIQGYTKKQVETRYKHFRRKSQDLLTHPYHLFVENLDAAQKLLGPMPSAMVAIVFQSPSVL